MSDSPLPDDALNDIRDGNIAPRPCGGCGAVPIRDDEDGLCHFWHYEGCEVAERIRQLVDKG